MRYKVAVRIGLVLVSVLLLAFVGSAFLSSLGGGQSTDVTAISGSTGETTGLTAISTAAVVGTNNTLVVVDGEGNTVWSDHEYTKYFDVDPVKDHPQVIEFVAAKDLSEVECPAPQQGWTATKKGCTRNDVVRVNVSSSESSVVYSRYVDWRQWHDVDRVGAHELLVADIENNRVFLVNTSRDVIVWEWEAQSDVEIDSGGGFPLDWTHLNDVEALDDGRIMVSLRNQDRVVFLTREEGVDPAWTLGEEDDRSILFEQHNPDFIPAERGGPAVLVADSENRRVVEYQREGEEWVQTWAWSSPTMHWPRDADRLPNGNTLITNSNGNEVLEVDRDGDVVWSYSIDTPYEAERLSTGDESAGGMTASSLGLPSRGDTRVTGGTGTETGTGQENSWSVLDYVPSRVTNSLLFVTPAWMDLYVIAALLAGVGTVVLWAVVEVYWAGYRIRVVRET